MGNIMDDILENSIMDDSDWFRSRYDDAREAQANDYRKKLEEASKIYYNTDNKIMSDEEFDLMKDRYEELSGVKFKVGTPAPEGKGTINIPHEYDELMGSMSKCNTVEETYDWFNKLGLSDNDMILISRKFDGNALVNVFVDDTVKSSLTRGRDGKGMDLKHIFKDHKTVNPYNPDIDTSEIAIQYEAIITYDNFEKYMEEKQVSYANPRSVVSGILGRDDASEYSKYITLVPLNVRVPETPGFSFPRTSEISLIQYLYTDEITVLDGYETIRVSDRDRLEEIYNSYTLEYRDGLNYMIDGLVIEVLDEDKRKHLGWTSGRPNYAMALKFPYMEKTSNVEKIEFDFGLTGQITPVICYRPVEFNGAIQKRTSIASYKRFKELQLGEGSDILIQYRNDVLSYIEKLDTEHNKTVIPFDFIDKCPVCDGGIHITVNAKGEETLAYCANDECPGKVSGRITRYLKKLDVKGIAEATVERMVDQGTISNILDLYKLTPEDIDYFGPVQSKKIIDAIHSKMDNNVYDYEVFAGIGMKDIGKTIGKIIFKQYDLGDFVDLLNDEERLISELSLLEGVGPITVQTIIDKLNPDEPMYNEFIQLNGYVGPKIYKNEFKEDSKVYTFCVTGSLKNRKRDDLKVALEKRGHKVSGSVSSKTNYLVNNDVESGSSKNKKAKQLGVDIITEETLYSMLNIKVS